MPTPRDWIILASALGLGAAGFYILLPKFIQPLLRALLAIHYRFEIRGLEHVPRTGPALLTANHTTWLDGFVLAAVCPRHGRALVNAGLVSLPVLKQLVIRAGIIPTPFSGPRAIRAAISGSREALDHGHVVALFPEGQISRNGLMGPFYRGLEVILNGREAVPVVPVAIDNLWGSIFSRSGGRFFFKRPEGWRRTVNVVFGPPVATPVSAVTVRRALGETMVAAYRLRPPGARRLPETLDPALPRWEHPTLGQLCGSTADIHLGDVHQLGQKPGSVGLPVPGVTLRVVDEAGNVLPPETSGRIEALTATTSTWTDTGTRGRIDRDGFVRHEEPPEPAPAASPGTERDETE